MKIEFEELEKNLKQRNIDFRYCKNRDDVISEIKFHTESCTTIGIGNSQTLKDLKITEYLNDINKTVFDKNIARDKAENRNLKIKALTADCYISSCNAIAISGEIVNIDHTGNRVAAITYGPEKVILVVGKNKLVKNEDLGY